MQLLTFNEILTKLCDDFDELISPRMMARSNTNIVYLLFKAIAKGYEIHETTAHNKITSCS